MSHKAFTQVSVLILMLLTFFVFPMSANAGSACGSTYTVQQGDTLGSVASACGITVYDLYTANPGISGYNLYAGQVLTIPSGEDNNQSNNDNYNGYNAYNNNDAPVNTNGTYVVQGGDTLGEIANRYGISMNDLGNANPNIEDDNLLYPGQVINIPSSSWVAPTPASPWYGPQYNSSQYGPQYGSPQYGSQYGPSQYGPQYGPYPPHYWYGYAPTPTEISTPLSYGKVSSGAPMANIELSNKANADVYVSLQGTARDGTSIIREYPVSGTFSKTIPAGFYDYVAYVGGQEFSGAINLPGGSSHSITFHSHEVDAQ
jgi:LysM repeat protein